MRSFEQNLKALQAQGLHPVAISVDTVDETRNLRSRQGYTFDFLSDPKADVIKRYGVLHPHGGENGKDIARPAEFLLDRNGTVRWVNLTEDIRVRARPQQVLEAAQSLP